MSALLFVGLVALMAPAGAGQNITDIVPQRSGGPTDPALREFYDRLEAHRSGDRDGLLELADWAQQHSLLDQADQIYRRLLERQPRDETTYSRLRELAEQRTLSADSDCYREAKRLLDKRFVEYQSKRFVVFSDAEPGLARGQLTLLERAHHQFQRFSNSVGLRPIPLRNKLVCVLFESEPDYRAFGKSNDDVTDTRITGYYSPKHDWIVFVNARAWPHFAQARDRLDDMTSQVRELEQRAQRATSGGRTNEAKALRNSALQVQRSVDDYARQLDDITSRESIATVVHEATHQLLFHTGVQSRRLKYPLWICEGLATSFETDTPHQAFGPDYEYVPRRQRFLELLSSNELVPLRELIAIDESSDERMGDAVYQQGYALVHWMYRVRRSDLRQYIMSLADEPAGEMSPQRHVELFELAFGNVDAVERAWLRFERVNQKQSEQTASANRSADATPGRR